ncbi:MAG: citramalate synthase [Clostridia bacterium]|nr:citramalate synthase [Clostridia bacterium]
MCTKTISILDSTLRDGAQGKGISFSVEDKLQIVQLLDRVGVSIIEAGNPGSNPKELAFFERAEALKLENAVLASFGSTCRKGCAPEDDRNLQALLDCGTEVCVVFGKCWRFHVDHVLETTEEENLRMIRESVRYLREKGRRVIFDAEHFFDGYIGDSGFAMRAVEAAVMGGAEMICLCDTNGGVFPEDVTRIVKHVAKTLPVPVSVHFHDDCGMAVANSVVAVEAGAVQVQGTFLGFGERCGNANLSAIIPNLQIKRGYSCIPQENIEMFTHFARELAAITNLEIPSGLPYVGSHAFAHKAGMHADGVLKTARSFEHVDPFLVGNKRKFPTSEISGRAVVFARIRQILPELTVHSVETQRILEEIKRLEMTGYEFEGADASFELLVRRRMGLYKPFFELKYYKIFSGAGEREDAGASAIVKVGVGEEIKLMAAEGNGPVNALDTALRKALGLFYPVLNRMKLMDYKVRVLDGGSATASHVRVLITSTDGESTFTTVGVSSDVVDASFRALQDSIEYLLLKSHALNHAAEPVS